MKFNTDNEIEKIEEDLIKKDLKLRKEPMVVSGKGVFKLKEMIDSRRTQIK
jgi:hypothetical protein